MADTNAMLTPLTESRANRLCRYGKKQLNKLCGEIHQPLFHCDKKTIFRILKLTDKSLRGTSVYTTMDTKKNIVYYNEGFQLVYRNKVDGICTIPIKSQIHSRSLKTLEARTAYDELLENNLIPPFYQCSKEKILLPNSIIKKFDDLEKMTKQMEEHVKGKEERMIKKNEREKKMKEKPKEFLKVKKILNLTASSSDITDEEQVVMKSSTTTFSEKIKMCEEKMKEKFNNYEDSESIEWNIEGVNFIHSALVDTRLICQAELNITAEVDEEEYKEMLEEPTEFEGFDKSIDISNLEQKIITKNPFARRRLLFVVKIVSGIIILLLLLLSCIGIFRYFTIKNIPTVKTEKKKSKVVKRVRTNPKIIKKSNPIRWYDPILKTLKLKNRGANSSYTYIIYYVYYEVSKNGDKTTQAATSSQPQELITPQPNKIG
ncbi:hypothetical protein SNEBB_004669 [Seison nebaliae]|nr:hypothetical protein SNEBB_004669 [Seison nebaliae]